MTDTAVPRDIVDLLTDSARQSEQITQLAAQMRELAASVQKLATIEANREQDRRTIEALTARMASMESELKDSVRPRISKVDSMYAVYNGVITKIAALIGTALVGLIIYVKK